MLLDKTNPLKHVDIKMAEVHPEAYAPQAVHVVMELVVVKKNPFKQAVVTLATI